MKATSSDQYASSSNYLVMDKPQKRGDTAVSDWLVTLAIMMIPLVNLIMLFVWAFGGDSDKVSRANWAKASLLLMLIIAGMYFMLVSFLGIGIISLLTK